MRFATFTKPEAANGVSACFGTAVTSDNVAALGSAQTLPSPITNPPIIEFECTEDVCTFEAFGTVFRALHGQYVRPAALVAHGRELDYFGIDIAQVIYILG
jgi:hypothetical protein